MLAKVFATALFLMPAVWAQTPTVSPSSVAGVPPTATPDADIPPCIGGCAQIIGISPDQWLATTSNQAVFCQAVNASPSVQNFLTCIYEACDATISNAVLDEIAPCFPGTTLSVPTPTRTASASASSATATRTASGTATGTRSATSSPTPGSNAGSGAMSLQPAMVAAGLVAVAAAFA